jgi:hypothetical protein
VDEVLSLDAAAATRQGRTPFTQTSDDRIHIDVARQLFLVADALGPSYGGYHAPLGVDVGLEAIIERLAAAPPGVLDEDEAELRAAFAGAGSKMFELERAHHVAFEAALQRGDRKDRTGASRQAAIEIASTRLGRTLDSHAHFYASITAFRFSGAFGTVAQVGTCRAYLYRDGALSLLVREHSSSEEARRTTIATRLLGCIPGGTADVSSFPIERGDRILLCSDGLWNFAGEDRLRGILASSEPPQAIASSLVAAAAEPDGSFADDTSAVVVCVSP